MPLGFKSLLQGRRRTRMMYQTNSSDNPDITVTRPSSEDYIRLPTPPQVLVELDTPARPVSEHDPASTGSSASSSTIQCYLPSSDRPLYTTPSGFVSDTRRHTWPSGCTSGMRLYTGPSDFVSDMPLYTTSSDSTSDTRPPNHEKHDYDDYVYSAGIVNCPKCGHEFKDVDRLHVTVPGIRLRSRVKDAISRLKKSVFCCEEDAPTTARCIGESKHLGRRSMRGY